jgi:Response regulator containing a CheY-like receiver domain and an HTH DNA-binding domain
MFNMEVCQLTDREIEILELLAEGWCNKQIAERLGITLRTVKFHTNHIYDKLAVNSRAEAMAWAWKVREVEDWVEG